MNTEILREQLASQEDYLKVLLEKLETVSKLKRDKDVCDLELGFELGFIYRMFQAYASDTFELKKDLIEFFDANVEPEDIGD